MIQPEPQPSLPGLQPRSIEAVRSHALLGVPISMTDYDEAMEVMDGIVARASGATSAPRPFTP